MLKIGEFSRLSHLTVKALRFYEKEGILWDSVYSEGNTEIYRVRDQVSGIRF